VIAVAQKTTTIGGGSCSGISIATDDDQPRPRRSIGPTELPRAEQVPRVEHLLGRYRPRREGVEGRDHHRQDARQLRHPEYRPQGRDRDPDDARGGAPEQERLHLDLWIPSHERSS
jgi:hypothetical protein